MKTKITIRQGAWLGVVIAVGIAWGVSGPSQGRAKKSKGKIDEERKREMQLNPNEVPEDFGQLRAETQAEWAERRKEIQAEIAAERAEIVRLLGDERKAIQFMWGQPAQTSLDQYQLDPAFKGQVTYKDGYVKATSVVVVDNPAEIEDAKQKGQQHARAVLDQEIKDLKPTNGASVGDELKKPDSKLDEKKLDQFVTGAGETKVEGIVDLPEGKQGVKVSVEVPMADPQKPSLTQVLEPMVAEPAAEVKQVQAVVPPPPQPPPTEVKPPAPTPPPPASPPAKPPEVKVLKPPVAPPKPPEPEFNAPAWMAKQGPISGLIVDTRGTGFVPCLFPRLMDSYDVIYFSGDMSNSAVGQMGVSGWARSPDAATTEPRLTPGGRYTGEPLVLEPKEVEETVENKIVLKPSGAAKIKASDEKYRYLDNARVVVVVE
jgi:hypothetical protein